MSGKKNTDKKPLRFILICVRGVGGFAGKKGKGCGNLPGTYKPGTS